MNFSFSLFRLYSHFLVPNSCVFLFFSMRIIFSQFVLFFFFFRSCEILCFIFTMEAPLSFLFQERTSILFVFCVYAFLFVKLIYWCCRYYWCFLYHYIYERRFSRLVYVFWCNLKTKTNINKYIYIYSEKSREKKKKVHRSEQIIIDNWISILLRHLLFLLSFSPIDPNRL